jgi:hypothetical protein
MKALFIPADSARKVEVIDISGQDDIHALGGGISVPSRYDSDSIMFVIQRTTREMNVRATGHIEVPAAERIWLGNQNVPAYAIHGDVVVVGDGGSEGLEDVPQRLIETFGADIRMQRDHKDAPKRERNEDGILRLPGLPTVSENWLRAVNEDTNEVRYQWWDGKSEAIVWKEDGRWKMHFTPAGAESLHVDLGKTRSVNKALSRADRVIGMAPEVTTEQLWDYVVHEAHLSDGGFPSQRPIPTAT